MEELICELCGVSVNGKDIQKCSCGTLVCEDCFDSELGVCNECVEFELQDNDEQESTEGASAPDSMETSEESDEGASAPDSMGVEVSEKFRPEITITISGVVGCGKSTLMDIIAKRLMSRPLGYLVFTREADALIDSWRRIHKNDPDTEPEWDGRVRRVLMETSLSDGSVEESKEQKEIRRLADFILENFPEEPGRNGETESAVDVAIRLLRKKEHQEGDEGASAPDNEERLDVFE